MTNPETIDHTQEEHHHPLHITERGRKVMVAGALLLTGTAIGLWNTHNAEGRPHDNANSKQANEIEQLIANGPDNEIVLGTIDEGEATSKELERVALELSKIDNLGLVDGQAFATLESANRIEDDVLAKTGGSVQPGEQIISWRDNETGLIVSTRYINDK